MILVQCIMTNQYQKTYGILQLSHLSTIDYQIVIDYVILCEIKRRTYPIWSFSFNHVHACKFWKQTRKLTHIVCAWYLVIWLIIFFADRQLLSSNHENIKTNRIKNKKSSNILWRNTCIYLEIFW